MTSTFSSEEIEDLRNRTFDEIAVGDRASIERTLTAADIQFDGELAALTRYHKVIAHGMWGAALISAVLGTRLPRSRRGLRGQEAEGRCIRSRRRHTDDRIHRYRPGRGHASRGHGLCLQRVCRNGDGQTVFSVEAKVISSTERIVREIGALTVVLGGLDMLAFTAGVGEHSAVLRERICGALDWLGVQIDDDANRVNAFAISASHAQRVIRGGPAMDTASNGAGA